MSDNLNKAAREALTTARRLRDEGSVPTFLGINGLLALMHRMIVEYQHSQNSEQLLLTLVAYGLFAIEESKEQHEWATLTQEISFDDDISEEDKQSIISEFQSAKGQVRGEDFFDNVEEPPGEEDTSPHDPSVVRIKPGQTTKDLRNARKKDRKEESEEGEEEEESSE